MQISACRMLLVGIEKLIKKYQYMKKTLPNPSKKRGQKVEFLLKNSFLQKFFSLRINQKDKKIKKREKKVREWEKVKKKVVLLHSRTTEEE